MLLLCYYYNNNVITMIKYNQQQILFIESFRGNIKREFVIIMTTRILSTTFTKCRL